MFILKVDEKLLKQVTESTETCSTIGDKYCSADGFCECIEPGFVMDPVNNNECCKIFY
jgi:hypothetical protein